MGVVADAATGEIEARRKAPTPKDDPNQLPIAINDVIAERMKMGIIINKPATNAIPASANR